MERDPRLIMVRVVVLQLDGTPRILPIWAYPKAPVRDIVPKCYPTLKFFKESRRGWLYFKETSK